MEKALIAKITSITVIILFLTLSLDGIRSVIGDRLAHRRLARSEVAKSWTAGQTVIGPVLVVHYDVQTTPPPQLLGPNVSSDTRRIQRRVKHILPESLEIIGKAKIEDRNKGIFRFPVYTSTLNLKGSFLTPKILDVKEGESVARIVESFLVLGVSDVRGIHRVSSVQWSGGTTDIRELHFTPGSQIDFLNSGISAEVSDLSYNGQEQYAFEVEMTLAGMEQLTFAPTGKNTNIMLSSSWPHPSFIGDFLPQTREIKDTGFAASWNTSHIATNSEAVIKACGHQACFTSRHSTLGVAFIEPVDLYRLVERSVKYGILFIVLTFSVFVLTEMLRGLAIHPAQYGLVGCALAIFYLLFLSLAEHISIAMAYSIAMGASIFLLSFYVSYVVRSVRGAMGFCAVLSLLYGFLYFVLQSEDYALLMGTTLLFVSLATVMYLTRNVNWYSFSGRTATAE